MDIQNMGNTNITSQNGVATKAPSQASQITVQQSETRTREDTEVSTDKHYNEAQVSNLVNSLNKSLDPFNTTIQFGFDNREDVFYVSVKDTETNREIRRFPAAEGDSLLAKMQELTGILFDEKG